MADNIGHALLVGIALYFYYEYNMPLWATVFFIVFALGTWTIPWFYKERKQLLDNINNVLERLEELLHKLTWGE